MDTIKDIIYFLMSIACYLAILPGWYLALKYGNGDLFDGIVLALTPVVLAIPLVIIGNIKLGRQ